MMIDENSYQNQMEVILEHSGGTFLMVKISHCQLLQGDGDAVIVLAYFLNLLRMKDANIRDRKRLREDDLWFRCPAKMVREKLGMGECRLRRAIEKLATKELIKTDHRLGNILWVKIDTENLKTPPREVGNEMSKVPTSSTGDLVDLSNEEVGNEMSKFQKRDVQVSETRCPSFSCTNKPDEKRDKKTPLPPCEGGEGEKSSSSEQTTNQTSPSPIPITPPHPTSSDLAVLFKPKPKSPSECLAEQFLFILAKHRKDRFPPKQKKTWKENIHKAAKEVLHNKTWTFEELQEGLTWFDINFDYEFTPQLYGPKFFLEFGRIKDAMRRKALKDAKSPQFQTGQDLEEELERKRQANTVHRIVMEKGEGVTPWLKKELNDGD